MVDIAIIRSNSIIYDPRVRRILRSLSKRYSVLALGWSREGSLTKSTNDNIGDLKLFNLNAPIGKPSLIMYLPLFWIWVLFKLFVCRPKVVHACDLDTILPCYVYKIIFKKKIVFDVFDRYAMAYIPLKFKALYSVVNLFEELFSGNADMLITVSEKLLSTFQRKPKYGTTIIMNCPEDHVVATKKVEKNVFTLVYTGAIVRNRGLERIAAAIKNVSNVQLVIAGRVINKELLDQILALSNVRYVGVLYPIAALDLEACADAMVILYNLDDPINDFAMPNKIFESMMFGLPLISNVAPELINEVECGIVVDYNNINEIISAVVRLRDNVELRRRLGNNGRTAFLKKYNWAIMEEKLHKIYENLLGK